ncbi:hypothetical protein BHM03_00010919 [Ensete ventricosum]|nr:hypothetical protein BHM03_00010919 [Ensete ventricosum]
MLRPGVTQEWVDKGELPWERTKNRRWRRPYDVLAEATRGKVNRIDASPTTRWQRPCMRVAVYLSIDQGERLGDTIVLKQVVGRGEEATTSPLRLSYPKVKYRLERRWTRRSTTVPQRRIYRSRRKGCRCKSTDSRAMGLVAPWYHRCGTSMESSISCSHGGRALVVKGAEEVKNVKANSKYQHKAEGQRPRNFIRPVSMDFSSR